MSRRRRIALLLAGLLVLLPSAAVLVVASTERGLQAVATRLGRLGPVTLHAEGVSGTLAGGARIELLDIEHPRVHLRFTGIDIRLQLAPLLWQTIDVPALQLETALVEVRHPTNTNKWNPRFLPALMRIHADSVRIARGTLVVPNGMRFDVTNVDSAGAVLPKQVRIYRSELDLPTLHLATDGRLYARDPIAFSGQASAIWQLPGQPQWAATASFDGGLADLPLKAALTAPFHASVTGHFTHLTSDWGFAGQATVKDFDIVPFGGGKLLGLMQGELALAMNRDGFQAKGQAESTGLDAGPFDVDLDGFYRARRLTIRESNFVHRASRARVTSHGTVDLIAGRRPQLDLGGDWQAFRWPLRGTAAPPVQSPRGTFTLRGDRPYQVDAEGEFRAAELPVMSGTVSGLLDSTRFTIARSNIAAFGGRMEARGEVVWSPQQTWALTGTTSGIDPAQWRADLPGRLGFGFAASGRRFAANGDLDLRIERLGGTLRGSPAQGSGRIERNRDLWRFTDLDLRLGRTRLTLDGSLGTQRDLHFGLNTDDLSLLSPDARGRIAARGSITGTAAAPVLGLRAQGSNFVLGKRSLRNIDADIDVDLRDGGTTRGRLRLRELRFAGRLINTLEAEVDGKAGDNSAFLSFDARGLHAITVAIAGMYSLATWARPSRD